ncbi:MAG: hypothetical protein RBT63_08195 [Bdellovibrionales bacterium]|jgi:hypothetical protein|nr:hypothetical protein [Bdellovibrionales bacterium]
MDIQKIRLYGFYKVIGPYRALPNETHISLRAVQNLITENEEAVPVLPFCHNLFWKTHPQIEYVTATLNQRSLWPRNAPWIYEFSTTRGFSLHPELNLPSFWGNLWESVPTEAQKEILSGKMTLVVSNLPEEASPKSIIDIIQSLKKSGAPITRCRVLVSGLYRQTALDHIRETTGFQITPIPWFELYTLQDHQTDARPYRTDVTSEKDQEHFLKTRRSRKYTMLNRRIAQAPHRILSFLELLRRNLIDQGHVSMTWQCLNDPSKSFYDRIQEIEMLSQTQASRSARLTELIQYGYETFANGRGAILPKTLDRSFANDSHRKFSNATDDHRSQTIKNYFIDSYFSLIAEGFTTQTGAHDLEAPSMISEKVFYPIMNLHPFIILGEAHSLARLREYGYKTFSNWIDESYDDIESTEDRLFAALQAAETLCGLSEEQWQIMLSEMWPVLLHNRAHVQKRVDEFMDDLRAGRVFPNGPT